MGTEMLRVLVVDPRASFRRKLTAALERACEFTTVPSLEEPTDHHLVVLSLLQVKDDGLVLASSLRASDPDLRVAVYGAAGQRGLSDRRRKELEQRHGLFAYLAQSLPAEDTGGVVAGWIRRIEAELRPISILREGSVSARIRPQQDAVTSALTQEIGMTVLDEVPENPTWGEVMRARPNVSNLRRVLSKDLKRKD